MNFTDILLLLCVTLSNGLMGLCEKLFINHIQTTGIECSLSVFSLLTFIFAAIILIVATLVICKKDNNGIKGSIKAFPFKKLWIYIILIAIFLFFNTYFSTMTNAYINNTVLIYPLKFGSNLLLSAIMAAVMFKERITSRSVLGMVLITLSILFINVF